jgi:hypothetical protein
MTHEHLNDEQLSAHLDGERAADPLTAGAPDATVESEIDACERCRARLAALAEARALVRRPVIPVLPTLRAEAVAAAVAEGLRTDQSSGQAPAVLSLGARRRSRSTGLVVGAAAAAAVLVAVVVAVGATHTSTPSASSASPASTAASAPHRSAAQAPAPTDEKAAATAVPDLGSINSVQALRSGLAGVTDFSATNGQVKGGQSTAGSAITSSPSPAAGVAVPTTMAASSPCLTAAPAEAAVSGTPTLLATVTYDHVPALVLAAEGTGASSTPSPSRLIVVVARTGCRILARTTL